MANSRNASSCEYHNINAAKLLGVLAPPVFTAMTRYSS